MIRQDLKYQFRHGFYYIYAGLTVLYVILLQIIPEAFRGTTAILFIFTDTSILGFFFIGGMVMLERSEQLFESLFVTPLKLDEYLLSKVLSLSILAVSCSIILYIASGLFTVSGLIIIVLSVTMSNFLFVLLGVGIAVIAKSINHFFMYSMLISVVVVPTMLEYFGLASSFLFYIAPTTGTLALIEFAFLKENPLRLIPALISIIAWGAAVFIIVRKKAEVVISKRMGEKSWIKL